MTNRRFWLMAAGIWAIASILLIAVAWTNITSWRFPDPDDQMRLLQVRDWMAGQSWFDVTQHRLNVPIGVPMHWSRLVDLPIAAVILVARPLFGQVGAEQLALVVVPLLTFGAVMAALAALGRRLLGDDEQALMALCVAPLSIEVLHQLRPMRIDHHGWQMALALLAAFALVGGKPKPAGFLTGAAIAIWLSISLEGLPMVAAILAFVALKWAIVPGNRMMLVWTAATTTAGAVGIYALTHGAAAWTGSVCDAVSPVYLAVLAVATAGVIVLTVLPLNSVAARLGGLAVVGAVSLPLVPAIAPQCLAGPFGQLDPLVRHFWYENVAEGLPIWMQTPSVIANTMALPLVGLIGTAIAIRNASDRDRERWITIVFLLGASTLAAVFVQRSGGYRQSAGGARRRAASPPAARACAHDPQPAQATGRHRRHLSRRGARRHDQHGNRRSVQRPANRGNPRGGERLPERQRHEGDGSAATRQRPCAARHFANHSVAHAAQRRCQRASSWRGRHPRRDPRIHGNGRTGACDRAQTPDRLCRVLPGSGRDHGL